MLNAAPRCALPACKPNGEAHRITDWPCSIPSSSLFHNQALTELDRKHLLMKETYEVEINRLKGISTNQDPSSIAHDGVPVTLPDPQAGGNGERGDRGGVGDRSQPPTVSRPDSQGPPDGPDQPGPKRLALPSAAHSFGGPPPPQGPQGPQGPPGGGGAPLLGISSLPTATHSGSGGGGAQSGGGGPRIMSGPAGNVGDSAGGGGPSMGGGGNGGGAASGSGSIGNGGGGGGAGIAALIKKDQSGRGSMPPQGPGPIQPNLQGGTPAGMTAAAQQSGEDQDYVVYPNRDVTGSIVDMKVNLQNSFVHDSVVCCVQYSWNGEYLATGSNRSAQIFDVQTGSKVAVFARDDGTAHDPDEVIQDSYVRAVCFSPDGNWLITGAEDHVVKVWDVRNRTVKFKLCGHDTDIYSVDAAANSQFVISGSGDKKAKLWGLESGKLLSTLGGEFGPTDGITSVSVSPTSQHVAAGSLDKIVRVWDVESSRLVRQFEGHRDSVYSVAFSPDGRHLLSGSLDKTLKLWDLAAASPSQQCRLSFSGHKDFVLSVAFSPNGQWLISGSKDRSVQFWDARQPTMCLMLQGHKNSVISIAHNPVSPSLATGSGDCRARVWSCL